MSIASQDAQGELLVLIPAGASEELLRAAGRPGWRVVELDRGSGAEALELAERRPLLWLHPWTRLDDALVKEIESLRGRLAGARGVVFAELEMTCDRVELRLGRRMVLASAGAWRLTVAGPAPLGAPERIDLDRVWCLRGPASISEHLQAVNRETTSMARLGHTIGEAPRWSGVALVPLWKTVRVWLGARGSRQHALTRAFLEGYREAVATAKLWEVSRGVGARRE